MVSLGPVDAARLTSLATGRGGLPSAEEWPWIGLILVVLALVGTRILMTLGLTRIESLLVAGCAPLLVLVDAPLGEVSPRVSLAANLTGCVIPMAVSLKIMIERRFPLAEGTLVLGVAIIVAFASSTVVPDRGVLLQYRVPSLVVGFLTAGLLYHRPEQVGGVGFASGALGVVVGADLFHLRDLAEGGGAGRIILGGAGLLDGILLVAVLTAAVAYSVAYVLRAALPHRGPSQPAT